MSQVTSHPVASGQMPMRSPGSGVALSASAGNNMSAGSGTVGQIVQGPAGAAGAGPTEVNILTWSFHLNINLGLNPYLVIKVARKYRKKKPPCCTNFGSNLSSYRNLGSNSNLGYNSSMGSNPNLSSNPNLLRPCKGKVFDRNW